MVSGTVARFAVIAVVLELGATVLVAALTPPEPFSQIRALVPATVLVLAISYLLARRNRHGAAG